MNEKRVYDTGKLMSQSARMLTISFGSNFSGLVGQSGALMHAVNEFGVQIVCVYLKDISEIDRLEAVKGIASQLWVGFASQQDVATSLIEELPIEGYIVKFLDLQVAATAFDLRNVRKKIVIDAAGASLIDMFEAFDRTGCPNELVLLHNNFCSHATLVEQSHTQSNHGLGVPSSLGWLRSSFPEISVLFSAPPHYASLGSIKLEYQVIADDQHTMENYSHLKKESERFFLELGATMDPLKGAYGTVQCMLRARDHLSTDSVPKLSEFDVSLSPANSFSYRPNRLEGKRLVRNVQPGQVLRSSDLEQTVGIFLQARVASTRLPQKALLPFHGDLSCAEYLIQRLMSYPGEIGQIVLATTQRPEDAALEDIANAAGIPCLRGEDDDVLGRMVQTAEQYGWDVLVRVTGDDLFVSCECIEDALMSHLEQSADYTQSRGLPIGMNCELLDTRTLKRFHEALVDKRHGEWVTWFFDHKRLCRYQVIESEEHGPDCERYRVTLDYREDYDLMREVARRCHLGRDDFYVPTGQIIEMLRELAPEWLHDDGLFPTKRNEVGIELRFGA